jgi:uncharacterized coiled-coil DUF342 family protein
MTNSEKYKNVRERLFEIESHTKKLKEIIKNIDISIELRNGINHEITAISSVFDELRANSSLDEIIVEDKEKGIDRSKDITAHKMYIYNKENKKLKTINTSFIPQKIKLSEKTECLKIALSVHGKDGGKKVYKTKTIHLPEKTIISQLRFTDEHGANIIFNKNIEK